MISLTCAKCQTLLTLDDAFAGAVCRCQHCGALQKVPANPKRPTRIKSPLESNGAQGEQEASLTALADAITSSGLAQTAQASGSTAYPPTAHVAPAVHVKQNRLPVVLAIGGVVVVALVCMIILLMNRRSLEPTPAPSTPAPPPTASVTPPDISPVHPSPAPTPVRAAPSIAITPTPSVAHSEAPAPAAIAPPTPAKPSFLGIDLSKETSVIFLLDHGNVTASDAKFDYARLACYKTAESLGPTRKFQVILWDTSGGTREDISFPPVTQGPVPATKANVDACRAALDDTYADGQSDVKSALVKALDHNPSAIVIVTAKTMDDDFTNTVLQLRPESGPRIHCVSLGLGDTSPAMSTVAKRTGGQYNDINLSDLEDAAH